MKILLLTHRRELNKKTNTGSLVADVLQLDAEIVVWERTVPSPVLLDYIAGGSAALLYPTAESDYIAASDIFQYYIIIDGTWQEANKIYNRSPYLHGIPTVKVRVDGPSVYNLRRNQRPRCLCTAECAIEVLMARGFNHQATELQDTLTRFLTN